MLGLRGSIENVADEIMWLLNFRFHRCVGGRNWSKNVKYSSYRLEELINHFIADSRNFFSLKD